jgi:RNA polymerase sigma-54 factor
MATKQGLSQKTEQKQRQLQLQRQLGSMVEKNTLEMEDDVRKELDENPALEEVITPDEGMNSTDEEGEKFKESSDELQRNDEWAEGAMLRRSRGGGGTINEGDRFEPVIVNDETLMDHLWPQLAEQDLNEQDEMIARHIIGNIDNWGYLRRSVTSIADDVTFKEGVSVETDDVKKVLELVKQLEPAGIAAESLQECLILQLERNENSISQLALRVISDLFDQYTRHNYAEIRSKLGIDQATMQQIERTIRHLDPKPGAPFASSMEEEHGQQITPDFLIEEDGDDLILSLCNNIPELQISQTYAQVLAGYERQKPVSTYEKSLQKVTKQKVDKATGYINLLKMRQNTLYRIMRAIMVRQSDYFHNQGDELLLKPMVLREISEDTGIDISVISRATNNKYVETPWGIRSLKSFFSEGLKQKDADGNEVEVATLAIKKALNHLVDNEDPINPLSDDRLCELLREQGFQIARRTVAKYRDQLMIDTAQKRRKRNTRL